MKLEILLFLTGLAVLEACFPWLDGYKCQVFHIKSGEPYEVYQPHSKLTLSKAIGTMEIVFFKELQDIEKLTLNWSEIDEMEDGTLCSIKKLQTLIIEYNDKFPKLTHKSMGECEKLTKFEYTKFSHTSNEFSESFGNDAFKSMKNIEEISLTKFVFKKFEKAVLDGLKNLKKIWIMSSKMEEIEDDAFCAPNLELLYLTIKTNFFSRKLFNTCSKVENLYIDTDLKNVFEQNTLQSMTNLKEIFLQVNLGKINKHLFANLIYLETINLGKCNLTFIEEDAFSDQTNLRELIIMENSIQNVDAFYLKPLKNLEHLNLVNNGLTTGVNHIQFLPNLKYLRISNNGTDDINATAVMENLPKLEKLEIYIDLYFVIKTNLTCEKVQEKSKEFGSEVKLIIHFGQFCNL